MTELYAVLCGEPWCYRPEEVGRLTLYQIRHIIFRERDKEGMIHRDPSAEAPPDPREDFVADWMRRGLSRERALRKWREFLRDQPHEEG